MRILIIMLLAAIGCGYGAGCTRKEAPPPNKATRISATKAFESYFGPAPTTDKGTCYAFVIYFPAAKEPGKVVPFPFFTFDEASLKKVALQRLMGGMVEKSYAADLPQLFPTGCRLLSVTEQKGLVTADFGKELRPVAAAATTGDALFNAITLTALQFGGVSGVRILSEGSELFPGRQPPVEASAVLQPSAPRLLNVVAMKETAAGPVQEVDALFDRPVDISECRFTTLDGQTLTGDVFHSMFDMAAVLKPKEPGKLADGAKIKVAWKVTDKKGRSAAGEETLTLEVKVHQD